VVSGIPGWLRWISPWVALGLAAALAYVLLRPAPEATRAPAAAAVADAKEPAAARARPAPAAAPQFVSYADAVDATAPAVVNIYTERARGRSRMYRAFRRSSRNSSVMCGRTTASG
jgi:S1-C subfamily serine protease